MAPEEGLAVLHFPSTLPEFGGVTDYNAWHEVLMLRASRGSAPLPTLPTYTRTVPRPPPSCLQRPPHPAAELAGRGCRRRQVDSAAVHLEPSGVRLAARAGPRELGAEAEAL